MRARPQRRARRRSRAQRVRLDQRQRLSIAVVLGAVAAGLAAIWSPWQLTALVAWDVAAVFITGSVWTFVPFLDPIGTRLVATREDDSRAAVDVFVVAASLISVVGVVGGLSYAQRHTGALASSLTGVSVFTVFLSWFTVHTLFVLRYAHLYYVVPEGGIIFARDHDDDAPDYLDFVYVAFTVGMTFQVSDTGVSKRQIRRAVIHHALLSYLFGTVIVGVAINVVGNLIQ